jgi:hypothetical protein
MEDLYLKLDQILKFFTTDSFSGLPNRIDNITCTALIDAQKAHVGYLVEKNAELYFFPAFAIKDSLRN